VRRSVVRTSSPFAPQKPALAGRCTGMSAAGLIVQATEGLGFESRVDVLWAHSANRTGTRHRLEDHLAGTAARAREFGESFSAGDLAGYLGLVHDVGKAACAWQAGLVAAEDTGGRVGMDHKLAGTWLASRTAGVFAAAVDGHHGGLPSVAALKNELNGADEGLRAGWQEAIGRAAAVVPAIQECPPLALPA
jgi:CRISPR-associated endonuclease/helicase Cas3